MATQYHVNPASVPMDRRAWRSPGGQARAEWNELWKPPQNEFPFTWGRHWKHCVEYRVDDYAAEAGSLSTYSASRSMPSIPSMRSLPARMESSLLPFCRPGRTTRPRRPMHCACSLWCLTC